MPRHHVLQYQIGNPYVDSNRNGFNYLISKFRSEPIAAHLAPTKGERSQLAKLAANVYEVNQNPRC